ncbi:MAG: hypothetical protein WC100_12690, partial [Sterolibacterium sp.]
IPLLPQKTPEIPHIAAVRDIPDIEWQVFSARILKGCYLLAKSICKEKIIFKQQHIALDIEKSKGNVAMAQ